MQIEICTKKERYESKIEDKALSLDRNKNVLDFTGKNKCSFFAINIAINPEEDDKDDKRENQYRNGNDFASENTQQASIHLIQSSPDSSFDQMFADNKQPNGIVANGG